MVVVVMTLGGAASVAHPVRLVFIGPLVVAAAATVFLMREGDAA